MDLHVDGAPVRRLRDGVGLLRRAGAHIHDDGLRVGVEAVGSELPTLVFPSIHWSASATQALTVHPLGNPSPSAEVGGTGGQLTPADARRMTDALRRQAEVGRQIGWRVSFEATHHGPWLRQPAFFVEIGSAAPERPPEEAVRGLAAFLPELRVDPSDRVAIALGGGHYAPHFTELALQRKWAVGHILPRHALAERGPERVQQAFDLTPGATGALYHSAKEAQEAPWGDRIPRLRDSDAPRRVQI
jgi:D-aminoacyl-tRNA deacylase